MSTEQTSENRSLYGKYEIRKTDGSPLDPNARYFILRYDVNEGALRFAERKALRLYAAITSFGNLAEELDKQDNVANDIANKRRSEWEDFQNEN